MKKSWKYFSCFQDVNLDDEFLEEDDDWLCWVKKDEEKQNYTQICINFLLHLKNIRNERKVKTLF